MRTQLRGDNTPTPHDRVSGFLAICPGRKTEEHVARNCMVTRGQVRQTVAAMRAQRGEQAKHVERVFG